MVKKDMHEKFDFLRKKAIELGAIDAKIISSEEIVVEDRVVLKCKLGCEKYGKTLACPPYAPSPEDFRRIVSEYSSALFMKFEAKAEIEKDLITYLSKTNDPVPTPIKEKVEKFWLDWKKDTRKLLDNVLVLEKSAAKNGYPLAIGFVSGSCQLCNKCNVNGGLCLHPETKRFSEEGVGVNVKATAEKAGVEFNLAFDKNPETFALLLID